MISLASESDDGMIDVFYLIDNRKNPTREQSVTSGRVIGDQFLAEYLTKDSMLYCGYIVEQGQFAPFWRLAVVPKRMIHEMYKLTPHGYIGKVRRSFNSY